MAHNKGGDGQGSTKNDPKIRGDQDAIRRAKKAHQRKNRASGNGAKAQTLLEGIHQDRRERRDAAIARRQANEETQMQAQHEHQASMALASPAITNLKEGSVARVFAETIIVAFINARPRRHDGKSKTAVAVEQATSVLGEAWLKQHRKDANIGRSAAYRALKGAYIKVTTPGAA